MVMLKNLVTKILTYLRMKNHPDGTQGNILVSLLLAITITVYHTYSYLSVTEQISISPKLLIASPILRVNTLCHTDS